MGAPVEPRGGKSLRLPLIVAAAGVVLQVAALSVRLTLRPAMAARWQGVLTLALLVGAAVLAVGLLGMLFKVATQRSFEWFIAWRYLRDRGGGRSWTTLIVGCGLAAVALLILGLSYYWGKTRVDELFVGQSNTQRIMQAVALGVGVLAYVVIFFGSLLISFSIFTTISIFGVFVGTCALVIVLSVMGGFEQDLRQKILGTTAHAMITKPERVFSEHGEVQRLVARMPEVAAYCPFLESEVMVTSQTNLSGIVLLKGIEPGLIGRVTDLPKYLKAEGGAGSLNNLLHPERLARMPETRLRPMVSPPLGEPPDEDDDAEPRRKRTKPESDEGEPQSGEPGQESEPTTAPASAPTRPASRPASRPVGKGEYRNGGKGVEVQMWDYPNEVGKKIPARPVYPGIIIGAELAKNLRVYVGDDVNVIAPLGGMSPAGPIPKQRAFRVAGIFYSGMYEYDTKFAYVTIPAAQRFLGLDDEITGIELKVRDLEVATPLTLKIGAMLEGRGFLVADWKQMNSNLFSALKLEKVVMFIVLTFIVLVASFSIITNLIMVVLQKVREISALKTMGATHKAMMRVFLYAGVYIGVIGTLVGVLTGVGICLFIGSVGLPLDPEVYYISQLPVRMNPPDIALVAFAGVMLSFLATLYPSQLAARLEPAEGLRRYEV